VVGATDPVVVSAVRAAAPSAPLLLPGVGAQGGNLEEAVRAGLDEHGRGVLVSVSRGIAAAGAGAGPVAMALRSRIDAVRRAAAPA
jgi:orotidine-5'-phosphate decarboxylase